MIASKFAVAVHIMMLIAQSDSPAAGGTRGQPTTSKRMANEVRTNPVVIRRITGELARAGLVRVQRGAGGAALALPASDITLEDIWLALLAKNHKPLISLHNAADHDGAANQELAIISGVFGKVEDTFCASLRRVTLRDLAPSQLPAVRVAEMAA